MPRAAGNDKATRSAMLADELADEGAEPLDIAPTPVPPTYRPEPAPAPPPVVPADMATMMQAFLHAMTLSGQAQADALREALQSQAAMAREQIPENKVSPGISVYSHPNGDATTPRTALIAETWLGVADEHGKVTPVFEYHAQTLTEAERQGLNALPVGSFRIERSDGVTGLVRVVNYLDDLGVITRRVVAFPQSWLGRDQFAQVPSLKQMLSQVSAAVAA